MIVLGADLALLFNLLNAIDTRGRFTVSNVRFTAGAIGGIVSVIIAVAMNRKKRSE